MKFKLDLKKNKVALAVAAIVVVVGGYALSTSSSSDAPEKIDQPAARACADFTDGYQRARTKTARLALADKVNKSSAVSENNQIADRALAVGRSADDGNAQWKQDGDALAKACKDAGWTPGQGATDG
jgi:hypothetical protein